jgi:hypothetical protein
MKRLHLTLAAFGTLALAALSATAATGTYDLSFDASTPDNTIANGQITVFNDVATGGTLDITSGPDVGVYTLVTGSGADSTFTYDNLVTPGSPNGFIDSTGGLLWSASGSLGNSEEINLWYNTTAQWGAPADSYSLWGGQSGGYDLSAYGTADLTAVLGHGGSPDAHAPENAWTAALLFAAIASLEMYRRQVTAESAMKLCRVRA